MSKSKVVEKPFGIEEVMEADPNANLAPAKIVGVKWLIVRDAIDGVEIDRIDSGVNDKVQIEKNDGPWTKIVYAGKEQNNVGWVKTQFLEFL